MPTDSFLVQSTFSSKHTGIIKFIEEINALYLPEISVFSKKLPLTQDKAKALTRLVHGLCTVM